MSSSGSILMWAKPKSVTCRDGSYSQMSVGWICVGVMGGERDPEGEGGEGGGGGKDWGELESTNERVRAEGHDKGREMAA